MKGDDMKKLDQVVSSGNVFLDLGFSAEEAQNLTLRSNVMGAIRNWFEDGTLTQAAAAKQLNITQPRFNSLLKGRIADFSLDALVAIATAAGLQVALQIKPAKKLMKLQSARPNRHPTTSKRRQKVA
jgi:predicted XRE-type DNA-binding protein